MLTPEQIAEMDKHASGQIDIAQMDADAMGVPDFAARMSQDALERGQTANEITAGFGKREGIDRKIGYAPLAAAEYLGNGAGLALDVAGNAIGSAARYGADLTPQPVKDMLGNVATAATDNRLARGVGVMANAGGGAYGRFKQAAPESARFLGTVPNLIGAAPLKAITPAIGSPGILKNLAKDVSGIGSAKDSLSAAFKEKRGSFVQDLVTPRLTPTMKAEQFAKSAEQGALNSRKVVANAYDQAVIDTVASTGVKKSNSLLKNRMIIDEANRAEGKLLLDNLKSSKVIYSPTDMRARLAQSFDELRSTNPAVALGAGPNTADFVSQTMQRYIQNNPGTPAGLLKARQQFDQWAIANKSGVFDSPEEKAFTAAVKAARNTANNYIAEMVPNAAVKESLMKQSHLFEAADNINSKGSAEAATRIGRGIQKIDKTLPGNKLTRALAGGAAASFGAGAYFNGRP